MQSAYPSFNNYCCVACNVSFNNFDEQKLHYFTYHSRSLDQSLLTSNLYSSYRQLPTSHKKALPVKCEICNVNCSSQLGYDIHIKGKKHTKALNKIALTKTDIFVKNEIIQKVNRPLKKPLGVPIIQQSQILYNPNLMCDICQVSCLKLDQLQKHLEGTKHQKKMKFNRFLELKLKKDPSVYCEICDLYMQEESMSKHLQCGKHKRKTTHKTTDEPAQKKKKLDISSSVEYCGYCHVILKSPNDAIAHYQTQKHAVNLVNHSKNQDLWCETCQISFANQHFLNLHLNGFRHYVRLNRGNDHPEGELGVRLLRMREKMKNLKSQKRFKKFSYSEKYKFVPNKPQPINKTNIESNPNMGHNEIIHSNIEISTVQQTVG